MAFSFVLMAGAWLLMAGCGYKGQPAASPAGQAPEGKARRIALVTPYQANATTAYVIERFRHEARARGWQLRVTDTASDFDLLVRHMREAVDQKVNGIVLGMGDPARMTRGLEAARQAGIPVFGLDAGVAPGVIVNVTSDNGNLGEVSAEALVRAIRGHGNVIMFTHRPHPGVRDRATAAEAVFAARPRIRVIERKHIEVPGPVESARKITRDLLARHAAGSIAGIWAAWDEPALGALQAIQEAGRTEIKVVGIDGTDAARAEILKGGPFSASCAQDFDAMAARLAQLMELYFSSGLKPTDPWYRIPGTLITPENARR